MTSKCSTELLEQALVGELPADREEMLHRHLEECEACSAALEQMAGGESWCREAAAMLVEDELDNAVPSREEWSNIDFTVEHLEPSDEPNVLGKLGGYDVLEIIGRGGMGVVLKGFDRELKRCVAIKVLSPHLAQSSLAKKRFAREAQAAAAVVHPHVLAIHQVQPSGRLPFLVMPLVAGESLAQRLTEQGRLELKETLRIGMQAAAGLAAAHEQGLVHRDVKPANILLEKGIERAVLTDFGLARAADDVSMTRWGIIAGTPQYMSPEQARGAPLDGRSDLFSLGCVLYEMATGVSPFRADSTIATLRRLIDDPPPSMASLNPELPPWFVGIVDRLLEKDPSRRFSSAKEVSELLEGCLAHLQQPTSVPLPAAISAPVVLPAPVALPVSKLRKNLWKGTLIMFATFGIAFLGMLLMQATDPPDIAGTWTSEDAGQIVLMQKAAGEYSGTYSSAVGKAPGKIELTWSRLQRRFNGTWREGDDLFGDVSLRLVDQELRGARTTDPESKAGPAMPPLADFVWNRAETGESVSDMIPLDHAVREFNLRAASDSVGKDQPPLTEEEVIAAIRWSLIDQKMLKNAPVSEQTLKALSELTKSHKLPRNFEIQGVACSEGNDRLRIAKWCVSLLIPGKTPNTKVDWKIRQQLLNSRVIGEEEKKVYQKWSEFGRHNHLREYEEERAKAAEVDCLRLKSEISEINNTPPWEKVASAIATSLDEAIRVFNAHATNDPLGKDQPPLTKDELIAAIRQSLLHPQDLPVSDQTLRDLSHIPDSLELPPKFKLELLERFQPNNLMEVTRWSVRLRIPAEPSGRTTCVMIRDQSITSRLFGPEERKVIAKWQKKRQEDGFIIMDRSEDIERAKAAEIDRINEEAGKINNTEIDNNKNEKSIDKNHKQDQSVPNPAAELKTLQGKWKVVKVEKGKDADAAWGAIVELESPPTQDPASVSAVVFNEKDEWPLRFWRESAVGLDGFVDYHGFTFRIDPSATPKTIDLLIEKNVQYPRLPPRALGIYEVSGNRLKIRLSRYLSEVKGDQRPKSFTVEPESGDILFVLERYRPSEDEKAIQGSWTVINYTEDANPIAIPFGASIEVQFSADKTLHANNFYRSRASYQVRWAYTLNETKQPKQITMFAVVKTQGGYKRALNLNGIYKFEDHRLMIAWRFNGPAPEKFESMPGSGVTLLELKRAEPKPATDVVPTPDDSKPKSDRNEKATDKPNTSLEQPTPPENKLEESK